MESRRDEKSEYEFTSDGRLRSVFTKTITTVKNKEEVLKEIEGYNGLIEAGKNKIKNIKNERKNLKKEVEHIEKDIESCNKRIADLKKYVSQFPKTKKSS